MNRLGQQPAHQRAVRRGRRARRLIEQGARQGRGGIGGFGHVEQVAEHPRNRRIHGRGQRQPEQRGVLAGQLEGPDQMRETGVFGAAA